MDGPRFIVWRRTDRSFLALTAVLVFVLAALVTVLYGIHTVRRIDGASMEPTLLEGDRLLVTRGYEAPAVGDIVSFSAIDRHGNTVRLIKRVVALPGDTVEVFGDLVLVNGAPSEAAPAAIIGTESFHLGPLNVPEGTVYVLGDNRPVSLDSRFIGPIDLASVHGKAVAIIVPPSRFGAIDE